MAVTQEQRLRYSENRRKKYALRGEGYLRIVERNRLWRERNRVAFNKKRSEKRRNDPVWREAQNAKRRGRDQRHHQLKTHYGITQAHYDAMLAAQGNKCGICGDDPKETLCVDHCHSSGKVRGLLCRKCNTGLGCFKDDLSLFGSAVRYLEKWR